MYRNLEDLIRNSPHAAEIKRGIAVKQDLAGKSRKVIADILSVTEAFVSKWRKIYDEFGVNGLQSIHQGGTPRALLNEAQRKEIIAHIRKFEVFGLQELQAHIQTTYHVTFKSMQSYYELLHAAGMSWHKSQKTNPRRDQKKVNARRKELKKNSENAENQSKPMRP